MRTGLDTNVLIRFLTQDDPVQSETAGRIIREALEAGRELFLGSVVLCETVWVLESSYKLGRADIAPILERLLRSRGFHVEHRDPTSRALMRYRRGTADFSDYLIGEIALAHGCDQTLTFDRALQASPGFSAP